MLDIFADLDFDNIPFPEDYKPFVSKEYEGRLFRPPSSEGPALIGRAGSGLGDVISTVQFAYHISELYLQPVGISWKAWKPKEQIKNKLEEAIPALGSNYSDRVFVSDEDWKPFRKAMWPWYYSIPYFPADLTCDNSSSGIAAIQLDGKSRAGRKNLPKAQVAELTDFLTNAGLKVVPLKFIRDDGQYMPMREWVEILASAEIFFGVCSGGLHMAHCTRTPKVVFYNNFADSLLDPKFCSHRNESFVYYKDFNEMEKVLT